MGRETVSAFRSSYLRHLISRQHMDISHSSTRVPPRLPLAGIWRRASACHWYESCLTSATHTYEHSTGVCLGLAVVPGTGGQSGLGVLPMKHQQQQ